MAKKYVVSIYAEDGVHDKNFIELKRAADYFSKQGGIPVNLDELQDSLYNNNGYYSITDDWGRTISMYYKDTGTCSVCKVKNVNLCQVGISALYQSNIPEENRVRGIQEVNVCINCYNGHECGLWDLRYINGKHKIIKLK